MMPLALSTSLAAALSLGSAQLTIDGETTTHEIAACAMKAEGSMPARLLIEETDLTLNLVRADHMQSISLIRNNKNWTASRLMIGESWMDKGQPSEPIIIEWGESIRVEALLSSVHGANDKVMKLTAECG
ncbi:hypothetical protein [Euryhalocaulis caribicus]|uniref:hypothetical protein n=1 Tax=Euryhalocaulis caribicus TaxID=1161401 RepID=UPI0003B45372|nr:hypothetical protein [Euryhalocaulis caribicus]